MNKTTNSRSQLMKLGRRKKYLTDCILSSNLIDEYETDETIRSRVFASKIQPILRCSYSTFNRMLNEVNPQKQLDEIENQILTIKSN